MSRASERARKKRATAAGMIAAHSCQPITANPYVGAETKLAWERGWKAAKNHPAANCKGAVCGVGYCTGWEEFT